MRAQRRLPGRAGRRSDYAPHDVPGASAPAVDWLGAADLERIQQLRLELGEAGMPSPSPAVHKAERWAEYRERGGAWPFERWSTTYDQNMERARHAHAVADRIHAEQGWGRREVPVKVEMKDGGSAWRVLDIADKGDKRGMEIKSGYVTGSADVLWQAERDGILVEKKEWTITWYINGRMSEPLRKTLRKQGIKIFETHPNTPIKDLPGVVRGT